MAPSSTQQPKPSKEVRSSVVKLVGEDRVHDPAYWQGLVEGGFDAVVVLDPSGNVRYESPAGERIHGRPNEERLGMPGLDIVHEDDLQAATQALSQLLSRPNATMEGDFRIRHANGTVRLVRAKGVNRMDDAAVGGVVFHYADITDLGRVVSEARAEKQRYEALVLTSAEGIVVLSADGIIETVNPAFVRMLGYDREQLIGRRLAEITRELPPDSVRDRLGVLTLGKQGRQEVRLRRADDSDCWAIVTVSPSTQEGVDAPTALCIFSDITDLKRIQIERTRSERRFRGLVEALPDAVFTLDLEGRILFANSRCSRHFGWSPEALHLRPFDSLLTPDNGALLGEFMDRCGDDAEASEAHPLVEVVGRGGKIFPAELIFSRVQGEDGVNVIAIVRDISRRRQHEGEIRRLATFPQQNPNPVMESGMDGAIRYVNPAATRLGEHLDVNPVALLPEDHTELVATCLADSCRNNRVEVQVGDHILTWTYHPVQRDRLVHLYGVDITERKQAQARLEYDMLHDAETGLPNRALFKELLERAIVRGRHDPRHAYSVLLLDLDRFKLINDSLGHVPGNMLLVAVSKRLRSHLTSDAIVSRFGGDEFAILVEGVDKADGVAAAERVQEALIDPFVVEGEEVYVTASIGIAVSASNRPEPEDLIADAERAMYRAKSRGRAQYALADKQSEREGRRLLAMQTALRKGLDNGELLLFYQPIVSLENGRIEAFEALIRWRHPTLGLTAPAKFVPLAEDTGLILPMGRWVIEEACRQIRSWQRQGLRPIFGSVNLSARQFQQEDLVEQIDEILQESGLDPRYLKLEITESTAATQVDAAIATLKRLKNMGINVVIDDFGTGYSSLSYLQRLPIDLLKVDRSFVKNVVRDADSAAIVRAVIAMAHGLGLQVVAEGVETAQQLDFLYRERSDFIQGFYFSRPVPADDFADLLRHDQHLSYAPRR